MPRKQIVMRRELAPDPKYNSVVLAKFTNHVMVRGKKALAERIVYGALDIVSQRGSSIDASLPEAVFRQALENIEPSVEVKSRRVGGATYQVPIEVRPRRRQALAMRWLVDSARKRSEKTMSSRLAGEIVDAAQGRGAAVKKREDTHRMAEANKAFAHYRF